MLLYFLNPFKLCTMHALLKIPKMKPLAKGDAFRKSSHSDCPLNLCLCNLLENILPRKICRRSIDMLKQFFPANISCWPCSHWVTRCHQRQHGRFPASQSLHTACQRLLESRVGWGHGVGSHPNMAIRWL